MGTVWVLSEKQTKANIQTRSEPKKSRAAEVQVTYHVYLETSGRRLVPIRDTKITIYAWDESMREPLELVKTTNSAYNSELQKLNALHQKFFLAGKGSPTQVALARTQGNLSLIVEEMGNEKYDSQMALNRKLSSRVKSSKTNIDGKCKTNLKQGTYLAVVFRMAYMKYTINWFEKFEVTDEAKTVTLNHNNALIEQPPFDPFTGEFIRF